MYDGEDSLSPFVGAFCGHTSPGSFESTTNNVYLRFESDETNTGNGFTVFYTINSKSSKNLSLRLWKNGIFLRGFYLRDTSRMRSFVTIKPSQNGEN